MNQREKIETAIAYLSGIRDGLVDRNDPELNPGIDILMWLVEQLQQSLLILNTIPTDE